MSDKKYWIEKCYRNGKEVQLLDPIGLICSTSLAKKYEINRNRSYYKSGGKGLSFSLKQISAQVFREMKKIGLFANTLEHDWQIEAQIAEDIDSAKSHSSIKKNKK